MRTRVNLGINVANTSAEHIDLRGDINVRAGRTTPRAGAHVGLRLPRAQRLMRTGAIGPVCGPVALSLRSGFALRQCRLSGNCLGRFWQRHEAASPFRSTLP